MTVLSAATFGHGKGLSSGILTLHFRHQLKTDLILLEARFPSRTATLHALHRLPPRNAQVPMATTALLQHPKRHYGRPPAFPFVQRRILWQTQFRHIPPRFKAIPHTSRMGLEGASSPKFCRLYYPNIQPTTQSGWPSGPVAYFFSSHPIFINLITHILPVRWLAG